jgi:hypothetical protein
MTSKSLAVLIGVASVAVWLVMAVPLFTGEVYTISDLWRFYLPLRAHYASSMAHGEWPAWFSELFGGYNVHGAGQFGMCHPSQFLLYRFLPLNVALDLEILLAYPVMFAGMYLFLRRWELRRDCALFGAMLFTFSTFNIMRLIHPNALQLVAHFPWVLYCTDIVVRSTVARSAIWAAVGLALLNTSELLLGYPQYYWFSSLLFAAYVALLLCMRVMTVRRFAMLTAAVGLGIAGGAVQLLPTMDALAISVRKLSPSWPEDMAFAGSIDPHYLLQAFSPYSMNVSHKQRIYMGAIPLLLAVWALVRWKQLPGGKPLVLGCLILAFVMIWLQLGDFGGLYQLQTHLPFIAHFRYPSRYVHLMSVGLSICGAFALADLLSLGERRAPIGRGTLLAVVGVAVMSVLVTALVFRQGTEQTTTAPGHVIAGTLLVLAGAAVVWATARGARWALPALVVLAAADPAYYAISHSIWGETSNIEQRLAGVSVPPEKTTNRLLGGYIQDMDSLPMLGYRRLDGFEGLPAFRRLDYRKRNARRVAQVGWVSNISDEVHGFFGDFAFYDTSDMSGLKPSSSSEWFELDDPLPRARCVSKTVVTDEPSKVIDDLDVVTTATVESPLELEVGDPGEAKITVDRQGQIDVHVQCPTRQLLVVSESHDPGWRMQVDGKTAVPALRVNGDFLGCVVEPGEHDVAFRFDPPNFRRGLIVSLSSMALLAAWAITPLVLRKRAPTGT